MLTEVFATKKLKYLFFIFLILASAPSVSAQSATVKTFYRNLCSGKINAAKKQLSSTVKLHDSVIKMTFEGRYQFCVNSGGLKGFQIKNTNVGRKIAGVIGDVLFKDGSKESIRMKLYKEKGLWKIAWEIK